MCGSISADDIVYGHAIDQNRDRRRAGLAIDIDSEVNVGGGRETVGW